MSQMFSFLSCIFLLTALATASGSSNASEYTNNKDLVSDLILLRVIKQFYALYFPTSVNDVQCRDHSLQVQQGVKDIQPWALKMLDSSTKIPDGFLAGSINQLGNFDECVGVLAPDLGYGSFTGQHCYVVVYLALADTSPTTESERFAREMVRGYFPRSTALGDNQTRPEPRYLTNVPEPFGPHWSFCVPSSCSAADVTKHLSDSLAPIGLAAYVGDADCRTNETEPFKPVDWVALSVFIILGVLAVLSTAYDLYVTDPGSRREILLAFSWYTNGRKLLDTSTTGSDVLQAVHGIRFLSIAWVAYCHGWAIASAFPNTSLQFYLDFVSDPGRMYIRNGSLSVDSFFLLSGMLLTYIFLKEMERGTPFNVPLFYLHRYIRLTPPVAIMILFVASLYVHLGSGPLWGAKYALWETRMCVENWWVDLLYVQNYVDEMHMCLTQTWYLAVDMQLFWLSPLVLYPLWKWPKWGKLWLGFWTAASIATVFAVNYVDKVPVGSGGSSYTHMRASVWLIGIALGYLMHHTKKRSPVLNKWLVLCGWAVALFLTVGTVYLLAPFVTGPVTYIRAWHAFLIAIHRPAFALGLAWIIYACARGYGGFVNTFLSWSFFIPLSRLSFCIYLTHMAVQYALYSSTRVPFYINDSVVIPQFFADMIIATGCAAILSLMVEAPSIVIEKVLFGKKNAGKIDVKKDTGKPKPYDMTLPYVQQEAE